MRDLGAESEMEGSDLTEKYCKAGNDGEESDVL
jgi:hypothetical protein